jgi:23S rRNA (adenine2503-C2)-methyltransferase
MPINKKNNVADLLKALEYYYNITGLRPTLEYIPFDGFNDRDEDIRLLTKTSKKVPLKVNLIPYHSIEFAGLSSFAATLRPSSRERMESFAQSLRDTNLTVMIRSSAGEDINAACGQLAVIEGRNKKKR